MHIQRKNARPRGRGLVKKTTDTNTYPQKARKIVCGSFPFSTWQEKMGAEDEIQRYGCDRIRNVRIVIVVAVVVAAQRLCCTTMGAGIIARPYTVRRSQLPRPREAHDRMP